ncbi:MAG: glutathione peroxidase [Polyangiaceae bacterium]|nr:glutathione peroxidase [Polyangiaceae bacterium]
MSTLYEHRVRTLEGAETTLEPYRGKVLLIVNTASQCIFTRQYDGLEKLYARYRERGFVVLGFPCNQFAEQEPGTSEDIAKFCELKYQVSFPLFEKIDVRGDGAHPLFQDLMDRGRGIFGTRVIKWNFTKFLVCRRGKSVLRFAPITTPAELRDELELLL